MDLQINEVYEPHLERDYPYELYYGGSGSGKSHFVGEKKLYKVLTRPYCRVIISRKVARTIRNSQFLLIKDLIKHHKIAHLFEIRESTMDFVCVNGNMILSAGLDDPEKLKSIQEPSDFWAEEFTEFSRDDFEEIDRRLRTTKASTQFTGTFNPISYKHWIKPYFFDSGFDGLFALKTTYRDNAFIDRETYGQKLSRHQKSKVYKDGEWGEKLEGLVYEYEEVTEIPDSARDVIYGLDFGFTNSKTAIIKINMDKGRKHAYLQGLCYATGMGNDDILKVLEGVRERIYADSAEAREISYLSKKGLNIHNANKEVDAGISHVKEWKLFVLKGQTDLIMEFDNYKYDTNKLGEVLNVPVKKDDHYMDAARYAIHTHNTNLTSTPKFSSHSFKRK